MSPYRTIHHIKKLIDGSVKDEEKIEIIKWHFPDWDIYDGFLEELTDGEMLDMIYDMAHNSLEKDKQRIKEAL